ncbi:MAG: hypothetical protein R3D51_15315 [Hyphomicrobiaceae bacterium]
MSLLRSHPDILAHGEVLRPFNNDELPGPIWGEYREKRGNDNENLEYAKALGDLMRYSPERFIQSILFDTQGKSACGFKYKTDESLQDDYKPYTDIIIDDTDIKIIHLIRRNLLDQFISHSVVLQQTNVTFVHDEKDIPEIKPFKANATDAIQYFQDVERRENIAREIYAKHRSIGVVYEDLVDTEGTDRQKVLEFLGVSSAALSSPTKKIIKDSRSLVSNLSELLETLSDAGFSRRLS